MNDRNIIIRRFFFGNPPVLPRVMLYPFAFDLVSNSVLAPQDRRSFGTNVHKDAEFVIRQHASPFLLSENSNMISYRYKRI
jgi:hypothetical protein